MDYKTLRRSAALRRGSFTTVATDDTRQFYVFRRTLGQEDVLVMLNRGHQPATFTLPLLTSRTYRDVFTQVPTRQMTVPAHDVVVLRTH